MTFVNSLNGLAGKIIKGKFPSVSSQYSKNLRALVSDMLATNPKKRPDIEQILRKSFVQTRVKEFVADLDADELHRQVRFFSRLFVHKCFPKFLIHRVQVWGLRGFGVADCRCRCEPVVVFVQSFVFSSKKRFRQLSAVRHIDLFIVIKQRYTPDYDGDADGLRYRGWGS